MMKNKMKETIEFVGLSYKKEITKNMSVNVYLDVNNANYDYLTFETKAGN